jgi:RNA polymerase sigma-70 factor (ECF subfamily)
MTQLVGRYERPLYLFLLRLSGDAHLAEDLFQETFLRLHRARDGYRASQPLKPYLYRIALNVFRDARAKLTAQPPLASLDQGSAGLRAGRHGDTDSGQRQSVLREMVAAAVPDPAEDCQRSELSGKIRGALATLPQVEREVLVLRLFEDLTFSEIASVTNVPIPTAKSRLLYALRRLRPMLESCLATSK